VRNILEKLSFHEKKLSLLFFEFNVKFTKMKSNYLNKKIIYKLEKKNKGQNKKWKSVSIRNKDKDQKKKKQNKTKQKYENNYSSKNKNKNYSIIFH
jgi:hypothetical protein